MPREGQSTRGRYRMADHGQQFQSGGLRGMYVLNNGCGAQIWKPTWNKTRTVFRPLPGLNPENLEAFDVCRVTEEPRDVGEWIRGYMSVTLGVGQQNVTFILWDPRDDDDMQQQSNPAFMLRNSIYNAVKNGQCEADWNPLVFGGQGRPEPIKSPSHIYLIQSVLMEHKSEEKKPPKGLNPDDDTVVMMLSQSAGNSLLNDWMMRRVPDADGNIRFEFPDVVAPESGAFIGVSEQGTVWPDAPAQSITAAAADTGNTFKGYDCRILQKHGSYDPALDPAAVRSKVKDWDKIVRIPTVQEQIDMICDCGLPASAIRYALADRYREMLPSRVIESGDAPGSTPPAAAGIPQQPTAAAAPLVNGESSPAQSAATAGFAQPQSAPQGAATSPESTAHPTHAEPARANTTEAAVAAANKRAEDRQRAQ